MSDPFSDRKSFPVSQVYPELLAALRSESLLLLSAETGAGKSTFVPRSLLCDLDLGGKMIVLAEPRRLAAVMLANFLASSFGEKPGGIVGLAVRGETLCSGRTRLLVVTEGVLVRKIQSDMELSDVGLIMFDEFHERHLAGDLALALALDVRRNLRDDLKIMLMSATLDTGKLQKFLPGAKLINAPGRAFPLEIFFSKTPPSAVMQGSASANIVRDVLREVRRALAENPSESVLVFLPGAGEVKMAASAAAEFLPEQYEISELYGDLPAKEQRRAVAPGEKPRVIFSTNIAESSVTIDGIRAVVDCGWEKRMEFDHASLMDTLKLRRISKKSARQRAGRAGRQAAGKVYCSYTQAQYGAFPDDTVPEILSADLSSLALELAEWGDCSLPLPDAPPEGAFKAALELLKNIGAVDEEGVITPFGKRLCLLPLPVRIGAMLLTGEKYGQLEKAAALSGILVSRDFLHGAPSADIALRLSAFRQGRCPEELKKEVRRLVSAVKSASGPHERNGFVAKDLSCGALLALAYPDRAGRQRSRHSCEYLLSGGRAAVLGEHDDLIRHQYIAVGAAEEGSRTSGCRIRLAAATDEAELRMLFGSQIRRETVVEFDAGPQQFNTFEQEKFGAIVLSSRPVAANADTAAALLEYLKKRNFCDLDLNRNTSALCSRLKYAGIEFDWGEVLLPYLDGVRSAAQLGKIDPGAALRNSLDYDTLRRLEKLCPAHFRLPGGREVPVDYSSGVPKISVRAQMLYGLDRHPCCGAENIPLRVEILSPAGRPVQITCDLPGFWRGNWKIVQKEMKSRYPKHSWPDDPSSAAK